MKKLIAILCLFISCQTFSQSSDSLLKKYDEQSVYRYGSAFMKGGNKISFKDLQSEFQTPSVSFDLYKKSKKDMTISTVLRFVSLFAIVGVVKGASDNNRNLAYGFMAGQLAVGFTSQAFRNKSIIEMDRAIQIRNREILFPGR